MIEKSQVLPGQRPCQHAVKIDAFFDRRISESKQRSLMQHIESCDFCHKQFETTEAERIELRKFIPKINDQEAIESLEKELSEIISHFSPVIEAACPTKWQRFKRSCRRFEKEMTHILFSKDMVKYYMFSVILGVSLKLMLK